MRTVKQKVWNEAENRERDWGEKLKNAYDTIFFSPIGRVRLARFARKTLTPRFTDFFTDFEKKIRLFCSLLNVRQVEQCIVISLPRKDRK